MAGGKHLIELLVCKVLPLGIGLIPYDDGERQDADLIPLLQLLRDVAG